MPRLISTAPFSAALRCAATTLALGAALLPAWVSPAHAALVTLNFDSHAGVNFMGGTTVTPAAQLHNQYLATHGVSFTSDAGYAALVDLGPGHAYSGRTGVAATNADGTVSYHTPLSISFFDVNDGSAGVTDYVSWHTDYYGDGRLITLVAYDIHGRAIGGGAWRDMGYTQLSLSVPGMHRVSFFGDGTSGLDNLSFNTVTQPGALPVPEPGSAALAALGLAALTLSRRRQRP